MARYVGYKRPKNTKKTLLQLMHYLGNHKYRSQYYGNLFAKARD